MAQSKDCQRSWLRHCPYCDKAYRYTNFMRRDGPYVRNDYQKGYGQMRNHYGEIIPDTHQIACYRKLQVKSNEDPHDLE